MIEKITQEKITKEKITSNLKNKLGLSSSLCEEIVDNFFIEILELTRLEKKLVLQSFGRFQINSKKPRPGRNLQHKEAIIIPSRTVLAFSPSKTLKDTVNNRGIK